MFFDQHIGPANAQGSSSNEGYGSEQKCPPYTTPQNLHSSGRVAQRLGPSNATSGLRSKKGTRRHASASYSIGRVRRLCQFGFTLLLLAVFVTPIAELFDTWDAAGLADDTEFRLLVIVLVLSLILAVCALLVKRALQQSPSSALLFHPPDRLNATEPAHTICLFGSAPPLNPLRI